MILVLDTLNCSIYDLVYYIKFITFWILCSIPKIHWGVLYTKVDCNGYDKSSIRCVRVAHMELEACYNFII